MNDTTTLHAFLELLDERGATWGGTHPQRKTPISNLARILPPEQLYDEDGKRISHPWPFHHEKGALDQGRDLVIEKGYEAFWCPGSLKLEAVEKETRGATADLDRDGDKDELDQDTLDRALQALAPWTIASCVRTDKRRAHVTVAVSCPVVNGPLWFEGRPIGDWRGRNEEGRYGYVRLYPNEAQALLDGLHGIPGDAMTADEMAEWIKPQPKPKRDLLSETLTEMEGTPAGGRNFGLASVTSRLVSQGKDTPEAVDAVRDKYRETNPTAPAGDVDHAFATARQKFGPVLCELDVARAFTAEHRADSWRWVEQLNVWRVFADGRWSPRSTKVFVERIAPFARNRLQKKTREQIVHDESRGGDPRFAARVLDLLAPECGSSIDDWDQPSDWVAGPGGSMLHLRTREVRPATREDLVTRRLGCIPAPDPKQLALWTWFIETLMPDPEERLYCLRVLAEAIAGRGADLQLCLWLLGPSGAGKSVFRDLVRHLFGDYAVTAPPQLVLESRRKSGTLYRQDSVIGACLGARLVLIGDPEEGSRYDEAAYKAMCGGEPILGRVDRSFVSVTPTWLTVIAANDFPESPSQAIARRSAIVQTDRRHTDDMKDPQLLHKLVACGPAILHDLLWYLGEPLPVVPPESSRGMTQVEPRHTSFAAFVEENLEREEGALLDEQDLVARFDAWRDQDPDHRPRLSRVKLRSAMSTSRFLYKRLRVGIGGNDQRRGCFQHARLREIA